MSRVGLSKIENGRSQTPRILTKRALAEVLDFDEDELFPPRGERSPNRDLREWAKRVYKRKRR
jgi:transcriptional regulator with XRE-family HTH domain